MINNILTTTNTNLLSINYSLHTDDDVEFKRELILLMISNLLELKLSISSNEDFKKVSHKIKSTLTVLDCARLNVLIDDLNHISGDDASQSAKIILLNTLCDDIIKNLEEDATHN